MAKPIPDGFHTATPHLVIKDAASAIEFYKEAFGATEVLRLPDPDGRLAHAEIQIGDSIIMLAEEIPEWGNQSPPSIGGSPVRIHLYVEDVDAFASQAVASGAEIQVPVEDQFYGDRAGRLIDPFGHLWVVATHKEDLSPEDVQRRFEEFLAKHSEA